MSRIDVNRTYRIAKLGRLSWADSCLPSSIEEWPLSRRKPQFVERRNWIRVNRLSPGTAADLAEHFRCLPKVGSSTYCLFALTAPTISHQFVIYRRRGTSLDSVS